MLSPAFLFGNYIIRVVDTLDFHKVELENL